MTDRLSRVFCETEPRPHGPPELVFGVDDVGSRQGMDHKGNSNYNR